MRFTVKAKLAIAFGVVLLLSMAAGGLAYVKLSEMIDTADSLVSRANRMERAAELEKGILLQVRAEKNLIVAPESEAERFHRRDRQAARDAPEAEGGDSCRGFARRQEAASRTSAPPMRG